MHEAKTRLSELVAKAVAGQPFVIAKAGKPLVKVEALGATPAKPIKRIGFLEGQFSVPDDFDTIGQNEIEAMFYGDDQA